MLCEEMITIDLNEGFKGVCGAAAGINKNFFLQKYHVPTGRNV